MILVPGMRRNAMTSMILQIITSNIFIFDILPRCHFILAARRTQIGRH